jgi:hypothetical protein
MGLGFFVLLNSSCNKKVVVIPLYIIHDNYTCGQSEGTIGEADFAQTLAEYRCLCSVIL